ncbi:hypothetical protein F4774DRAFT_381861 [Daldinia eschscholtzii]|nr:hypothetical protein F4774DRAFT_381861 [Daldinia eschscholtzii]
MGITRHSFYVFNKIFLSFLVMIFLVSGVEHLDCGMCLPFLLQVYSQYRYILSTEYTLENDELAYSLTNKEESKLELVPILVGR